MEYIIAALILLGVGLDLVVTFSKRETEMQHLHAIRGSGSVRNTYLLAITLMLAGQLYG